MQGTTKNRFPFAIFIIILNVIILPPAFSIEITLNQRQIAVIPPEILKNYTVPAPSAEETTSLLLSTLFPWMESVNRIEVQSGYRHMTWNLNQRTYDKWENAKLVLYKDSWELWIGQDIFRNPDMIGVYGIALEPSKFVVWTTINDDGFEKNLESVLAMRDAKLEWRFISHPSQQLQDPPQGRFPHLIILKDIDLARLLPQVTTYRPVLEYSSRWITLETMEFSEGTYPLPLALNLYDPQTSLYWLLAENPVLFNQEGLLPDALSMVLGFETSPARSLINTSTPLQDLYSGKVSAAICPAPETRKEGMHSPYMEFSAPKNTVNILRRIYAAIPIGLSDEDSRMAELLLADALRFYQANEDSLAISIPIDPRSARYFDAYERIGRLALSNQITRDDAVNMINEYAGENSISQ